MAAFNGPGIRVLKQYEGQDGKTYVQLDTGETLATDSSDYEDYYAEGLLYGEDERGNFYPQEGAHDLLKQYQALTQQNSFENYMKSYFNDEITGSIAKGLGQSEDKFWQVNPSYKKAYDEQIKNQLLDQYVKQNPSNEGESRGSYMDRITSGFPGELSSYFFNTDNPNIAPGIWSDFRKGLYTTFSDQFGGGQNQLIKSIEQDPNLSRQEKNDKLFSMQYGEERYGGLEKLSDKMGLLAPLAIPGKMVQSAYKDDYSLNDAVSGKRNGAGFVEDVLTDPLTYTGMGVAKNINRLPQVADVAEALNRVGEAHLPNAYKVNPFAFRTNPESYYRQMDEAGIQAMDEALGFIKGNDGGPASYSQGSLYTRDGRPNFMVEANNQRGVRFTPESGNVELSTTPMDILDKDVNLYKRDWLQGYKQIEKPKGYTKDINGDMFISRDTSEPGSTSVYNRIMHTLMDGRQRPALETIRLETYPRNGEDYYNFFANMPSSKLKAGKAYKMLDEFIPVGGKIREDTSLSWDSFQNILKQSQQDKFRPIEDGYIPMNRMSATPGRNISEFANQEEFNAFFEDLNKQLTEKGFNSVKSVPNIFDGQLNETRPLRAQFPNIILQKKYQQGGVILPSWLNQ